MAARTLCEAHSLRRDTRLQFMILLSALLASLTGFVSGERQPVRAQTQVQASAVLATAQPEASVAVTQARRFIAAWQQRASSAALLGTPQAVAPAPRLHTRLALKQSWLN